LKLDLSWSSEQFQMQIHHQLHPRPWNFQNEVVTGHGASIKRGEELEDKESEVNSLNA
jgi:hypothetical protein